MVVAASAGHRQRLCTAHHHVYSIVHNIGLAVQGARTQCQEAKRGQRPPVVAERHLVGRDLVEQKLVVREVRVERADHPIAISKRERVAAVVAQQPRKIGAARIGVAGNVEPVAAPPLPISRRREQAIHDVLPRAGRRVSIESVDFRGSGRQSGKVVGHTAN